jgi:hypothetical protein
VKTRIALKSLSDLPSDADKITDAPSQATPESSPQSDDPTGEDIREMMRRRYTPSFPYQAWGLNE